MIRKLIGITAIYLSVSLCGLAQTERIVILHTNDTHSCIYPLNPNLADTMLAGRGGFIRRIEMLKQERKKDPLTHPYLREKLPWGLVPYVQALLLARHLRGDLDGYPPFLWK